MAKAQSRYDRDEMEKKITLEFLADPDTWPKWPALPLKRRTPKGPDLAVVMAGNRTKLYLTNLYMLGQADKLEFLQYDSVEDVVKAGWIID